MDMNLRVLVYSNPLVVDKIGKTFQYWKDSGFIYTKHLIKHLPEGWRFYWCIPDKIKPEEYGWFTEANKNIELIPYPYSTSIHQNRYNFSVNTLSKYFTYAYDIDVVLNNQPEVTSNLAVWFANQRREKPIIFSFYHWIDCEESSAFGKELSGYNTRQFDGARDSDYIMFHNEYAYRLFEKEALTIFKEEKVKEMFKKFNIFHPPYTEFKGTPEDSLNIRKIVGDKKIILFNHRLNNTTCWQEVVKICDEIYKKRQDFVLWLTDDSKLKELAQLKSKPYIIAKNMRDGEYGALLKEAAFSVCNHRGYSTWNMAVIDSFANYCLALIPNREVYQDMFPKSLDAIPSLISHNGNLKEMIENYLNSAVSVVNLNHVTAATVVAADRETFTFSDPARIMALIESHFAKEDSIPKKYEDVLGYIYTHNGSLKKDWVNEFWSFHVNSNFPIIRKRLLLHPQLEDDTTQSQTYYKIKEK